MQNRKRDTDVQNRLLDSVGEGKWGDVLREQHQNMYIIKGETDHQPRLDAWDKCLGLVHWHSFLSSTFLSLYEVLCVILLRLNCLKVETEKFVFSILCLAYLAHGVYS